jgi:MFS family permease
LTFLILASPVGVVSGFTLTSIMVTYQNWRWSFYIQALGILPCAVAFLLTPTQYLDIERTINVRKKCAHIIQQKLYKTLNQE